MTDAFYLPLAPNRWQPTEATIGPWAPDLQHGGPPTALLARALRLFPGAPDMEIARLTVEILGPIPVAPCEIAVTIARPGRRIELLQGSLSIGGKPVLLANAWRLERKADSAPPVPEAFLPPPLPALETTEFFPGVSFFPYGRAIEWRFVRGSFVQPGPALVWGRLRIPLVADSSTHGLEGLLTFLDSANGVSAELDIRTHTFVPVDLSLNLYRQPQGPWFGMDARTVVDTGGIGLVNTTVFDAQGALGRSLHTLFVRPR